MIFKIFIVIYLCLFGLSAIFAVGTTFSKNTSYYIEFLAFKVFIFVTVFGLLGMLAGVIVELLF